MHLFLLIAKIQKDLFDNHIITEIEMQHSIISKLKVSKDFLDLLNESKISKIIDHLEEKKYSALYPSLLRFFILMKDLKGFYTANAQIYFLEGHFIREDLVDWFRFFQNKYNDLLEYIIKDYFSGKASSLFQRITDFLEALIVMGETLPLVAEELSYDAMHETSKKNQDLEDLYYEQRENAISQFSLLNEANWLYYDLGVSGLPTDCRELQKRYPFPLNKKKVKENKAEFVQFIKKYSINEEKNVKAWDNLQQKVHLYNLW